MHRLGHVSTIISEAENLEEFCSSATSFVLFCLFILDVSDPSVLRLKVLCFQHFFALFCSPFLCFTGMLSTHLLLIYHGYFDTL